jgi:putative transcriptional regulator
MVSKIYNRIPVLRAECGISRRTLADAVEVNVQTIGYLERGDYYPSLELAMKIASYFNAPIEALFSFAPFRSIAEQHRQYGEQHEHD